MLAGGVGVKNDFIIQINESKRASGIVLGHQRACWQSNCQQLQLANCNEEKAEMK